MKHKRPKIENGTMDTVLQAANDNNQYAPSNDVDITVRDIFNLLSQGFSPSEIKSKQPEITKKTIQHAQAILIAFYSDLYAEKIKPKPKSNYKILVDENISPRAIPSLRDAFGHATHADFEGLGGSLHKKNKRKAGDQHVWDWAKANKIDAIVTCDKRMKDKGEDLTMIAVDDSLDALEEMLHNGRNGLKLNSLPLIIHLNSQKHLVDKISYLLDRYKKKLKNHIKNPKSPYLLLTEKGIKWGPTYGDFFKTNGPA